LFGQRTWDEVGRRLIVFEAKFALQDIVDAIFEGFIGVAVYKNGFLVGNDAKTIAAPVVAIWKSAGVGPEKTQVVGIVWLSGFSEVKTKSGLNVAVKHFLLPPSEEWK
jgi:hypothetical protein